MKYSRLLAVLALPHLAAAQSELQFTSGVPGDNNFGRTIATVGDIDGDGLDEYIVGAPNAGPSFNKNGRAGVYDGATGTELYTYAGTAFQQQLGFSVAGVGDTDGDGVPDFAIGSPFDGVEGSVGAGLTVPRGHVDILSGANGSLLRRIQGPTPGARFGRSVVGGFDFDGDGDDDVVIGGSQDSISFAGPGVVQIVSVTTGAVLETLNGPSTGSLFGWSLDLNDITGDGTPEILIGAPSATGVTESAHVVDVSVVGSPTTVYVLDEAQLVAAGALPNGSVTTNDNFGSKVCAVGDLNGDSRSELAVGAPNYDGQTGLMAVFDGATGAFYSVVLGDATGDRLGVDIANAGVQSASFGLPFIAVGAPGAVGETGLATGKTYVLFPFPLGSLTAGDCGTPKIYFPAPPANCTTTCSCEGTDSLRGALDGALFGRGLASVGDSNCDGWRDLLVGSPGEGSGRVRKLTLSQNPLQADTSTLSASAGGNQLFSLDAGPASAGQTYLLLGSLSGIAPATSTGLACGVLPLVQDVYYNLTLTSPASTPLQTSVGVLDSNGRASASNSGGVITGPALVSPPGFAAPLIGITVHHAFVVIPPAPSPITFVSNPVALTILP